MKPNRQGAKQCGVSSAESVSLSGCMMVMVAVVAISFIFVEHAMHHYFPLLYYFSCFKY